MDRSSLHGKLPAESLLELLRGVTGRDRSIWAPVGAAARDPDVHLPAAEKLRLDELRRAPLNWHVASGGAALCEEGKAETDAAGGVEYGALLATPPSATQCAKIDCDVRRTFPAFGRLPPCARLRCEAWLRRVLRAHAVLEPSSGYCQGMNFIAAVCVLEGGSRELLQQQDMGGGDDGEEGAKEEAAEDAEGALAAGGEATPSDAETRCFWTFAALMRGTSLGATLYRQSPGSSGSSSGAGSDRGGQGAACSAVLTVFMRRVRRQLPNLEAALEALDFPLLLTGLEWLSTLFVTSLSLRGAFAVVDAVLLGVPDALFRVACAVLSLLRQPVFASGELDVVMTQLGPAMRALDPVTLLSAALLPRIGGGTGGAAALVPRPVARQARQEPRAPYFSPYREPPASASASAVAPGADGTLPHMEYDTLALLADATAGPLELQLGAGQRHAHLELSVERWGTGPDFDAYEVRFRARNCVREQLLVDGAGSNGGGGSTGEDGRGASITGGLGVFGALRRAVAGVSSASGGPSSYMAAAASSSSSATAATAAAATNAEMGSTASTVAWLRYSALDEMRDELAALAPAADSVSTVGTAGSGGGAPPLMPGKRWLGLFGSRRAHVATQRARELDAFVHELAGWLNGCLCECGTVREGDPALEAAVLLALRRHELLLRFMATRNVASDIEPHSNDL